MGLEQFVSDNLWGIVVGAVALIVTYTTIKMTLSNLVKEIHKMSMRLDNHGTRINILEVEQARRLGYEQGRKDNQFREAS